MIDVPMLPPTHGENQVITTTPIPTNPMTIAHTVTSTKGHQDREARHHQSGREHQNRMGPGPL